MTVRGITSSTSSPNKDASSTSSSVLRRCSPEVMRWAVLRLTPSSWLKCAAVVRLAAGGSYTARGAGGAGPPPAPHRGHVRDASGCRESRSWPVPEALLPGDGVPCSHGNARFCVLTTDAVVEVLSWCWDTGREGPSGAGTLTASSGGRGGPMVTLEQDLVRSAANARDVIESYRRSHIAISGWSTLLQEAVESFTRISAPRPVVGESVALAQLAQALQSAADARLQVYRGPLDQLTRAL